MSIDNFTILLNAFIARIPFSPITIELFGGRRYEIDHPDALVVRAGIAVFTAPGSLRILFDHESVNQIYDAPAHLVPNGPNQ
jgi:hypothetical protein